MSAMCGVQQRYGVFTFALFVAMIALTWCAVAYEPLLGLYIPFLFVILCLAGRATIQTPDTYDNIRECPA